MTAFIDDYRGVYGVEPISRCCRSHRRRITCMRLGELIRPRHRRVQRDERLCADIQRVWDESGLGV